VWARASPALEFIWWFLFFVFVFVFIFIFIFIFIFGSNMYLSISYVRACVEYVIVMSLINEYLFLCQKIKIKIDSFCCVGYCRNA
jgi:hypothetical protein